MSLVQQSQQYISSERISEVKQALAQHRLYGLIDSPTKLRLFMQHHVFCVWDFMSLLKSIQRNLTGFNVPWLPPRYPNLARLINEIVLDEETDKIDDRPISHFQLYAEAMQEVGADLTKINALLAKIDFEVPFAIAMENAQVPLCARDFMNTTFQFLEEAPEVQVAVFFHAREAIIPPMFIEMVQSLQQTGLPCDTLVLYLERHIALDGDTHGPKAQRMIEQMFSHNPELYPQAIQAVEQALAARLALWEALAKMIETDWRINSLSQQAKAVLAEFIQAGQAFTVYEAVGLLTFRYPRLLKLSRNRLSSAFHHILKANYSHLRYKMVNELHSIRPMKRYLP